MTGRHRTLDNLAHRLDRAATIIPDVLDHLDEQRAQISNLAAQDTSRGYSTPSTISDPTQNTVQQLFRVNYRRDEIRDNIATLELAVRLLEQSARRALSFRASDDHDHELDSERDLLVQCIECQQIRTPRTDPVSGATVDDGRCIDCGRRYDNDQLARQADSDARRMRRANTERKRYYGEV